VAAATLPATHHDVTSASSSTSRGVRAPSLVTTWGGGTRAAPARAPSRSRRRNDGEDVDDEEDGDGNRRRGPAQEDSDSEDDPSADSDDLFKYVGSQPR
jgi:hypothetical protein